MSPVPGGRSSSSTSRSPQYTSARNCCKARCSIGPRHTTGVLPSVNWAMEMTFTSCAIGGRIIDSTWVGRSVVPIMRGIEWPWMSASTSPTDTRRGQVDRDRRLTHAALAGGDGVHPSQRSGLGERYDGLAGVAAQLLAQFGALLALHHVQADVHRGGGP